MKGRKGCYGTGGSVAKTRDVGGVTAPLYGNSKKVLDEAKGETVGKVGMGGIGVDGLPVKSRSDRPARRASDKKD